MNTGWRKNYLRYKTYFLDVMSKYNERGDVKTYLEILLSLVTISFFSVFALRPTLLTIAELIREIQTEKEILTNVNVKITNLSQAQSLYDSQRAQIALLELGIPKRAAPDVFARQIEGLSQKHLVAIIGITTGEALVLGEQSEIDSPEGENKNPLPGDANALTFSVKGRVEISEFQNITSFLADFEKLKLPAKIDTGKVSIVDDPISKYLLLVIEGRLPYYVEN